MELKDINKLKKKESKKIYKTAKKEYKKSINKVKHEYYIKLNSAPKRGVLEEIGNSITHGVGALVGVFGLVILLLKSNTTLKLSASLVYGISIITMMLMSCLYHAFKCDTVVKRIFRRFDYIGIYLLIGGTFAPIYLVYYGNTLLTLSGALALSIGIAIQNFPEGAIISMPLISEGYTKPKAFLLGTLSGIVEPIAAVITILLISFVEPILPYLLRGLLFVI